MVLLGFGGAAGGVRGTHTISGGDTITFLVGGGGGHQTYTDGLSSSFPDGGNSGPPSDGYLEGPGGGRSSIYGGLLPYANRDSIFNTFLLIGGGGGGGSHYYDTGTLDARGGYPSGFPGGGYYPSDSSDSLVKEEHKVQEEPMVVLQVVNLLVLMVLNMMVVKEPVAVVVVVTMVVAVLVDIMRWVVVDQGIFTQALTNTMLVLLVNLDTLIIKYQLMIRYIQGQNRKLNGYSGYGGLPNGGGDGVVVFKVL